MKRQEKCDAKREAILDAALRCFLDKGLAETRVEDIARAAGVAKGTIYLYFADKEAIFKDLVNTVLSPALDFVRQTLNRDLPLKEKLLESYRPLFDRDMNPRQAGVARLCFSEGMRASGQVPPFFRDTFRPLMDLRLELLRNALGDKMPTALRDYPMLLTSPLVHGIVWQGLFEGQLDLQQLYRAYLDLILPD